ncbi:MAG: DNA alkylation repair protein [Schleiferiaceae bacterium]|nr:DNA alkylation repair protein [Schleiferiaceae bacterium]
MKATTRKGSKSIKEIPTEILKQLHHGEIETANLVEWLAIDQRELLKNVLQQHNKEHYLKAIVARIDLLKKETITTVYEAIGTGLFKEATKKQDNEFLTLLATHRSDAVRCWIPYAIHADTSLNIQQKLLQIQPAASDAHFGVREVAWLALRKAIAQHLEESLQILSDWTNHANENIRRFASESTRPRGVWCQHIQALKDQPELGLQILDPLKADPAKYVRDSVGNWLNDASKTQPDFVRNLCARWSTESDTPATHYIIKKALRTIDK